MKPRLLSWLVSCYPRVWRDRYGAEFSEFLCGLPDAGWGTVWDVSKGAISMQVQQNGPSVLKLAAGFGLAGLIIAAGVSLAISDRYVSMTVVEATGVEERVLHDSVTRSMAPERLRAIIDKHRLYPKEAEPAVLLARQIKVSGVKTLGSGRRTFRIEFLDDDPKTAQLVANEVTDSILTEHARANAGSGKMLSVLDRAPLPEGPLYPNRPIMGFVGVLIGATIGAVWAMLRRRRGGAPAA